MISRLLNILRRLLWRVAQFFWSFYYNNLALDYVREWYPEELLLRKSFHGWHRFFSARWWWMKLVVLTLPTEHK